ERQLASHPADGCRRRALRGNEVRRNRQADEADVRTGNLRAELAVAARDDCLAHLTTRWIEREPDRASQTSEQVVESRSAGEHLVGAYRGDQEGVARPAGDADRQ